MARNDFADNRFLFPDMFSFSFDPEILTFLWGLCARRIEDVQPILLPKSALVQVFVPYEGQPTNFLTCLRYSVVTSGVIIAVGFSSYSTFRVLQKIRYEGWRGLKRSVVSFFTILKRPVKNLQTVRSLELVLRRKNSTSKPLTDLRKRPSDLQLAVSTNGSNGSVARVGNGLHGNTVHVHSLSVTPINGEIASGDEDVEDVQSQYFGPTGVTIARIAVDGIGASPLSPESAYRARYESLRTPETPSQNQHGLSS